MYDFPNVRAATDEWWAALAGHFKRAGIKAVPRTLLRRDDLLEQWADPALLFSQTCGYLLCHQLSAHVQPVATPHYTAAGCSAAGYSSVILVRSAHPAQDLEALRGATAVYSRTYSHAGYNAFRGLIAPLARGQSFFSKVLGSGSHVDSIRLLATGEGDVATVCCVIYAFVARFAPETLAGTRVLGYTPLAPAPPFVAPKGADPADIERLRAGLEAAMTDPVLEEVRAALMLGGVSVLDRGAYQCIADLERAAVALSYPKLS